MRRESSARRGSSTCLDRRILVVVDFETFRVSLPPPSCWTFQPSIFFFTSLGGRRFPPRSPETLCVTWELA